MLVTTRTRRQLIVRRIRRDLAERGYERVGEGGGKLWEMYRGGRQGHRITAVEVDPDGMSVWVRIEKQPREKLGTYIFDSPPENPYILRIT